MFSFRFEQPQDILNRRKVHEAACITRAEADLVDVFMIKELQPGMLAGTSGITKYDKASAAV